MTNFSACHRLAALLCVSALAVALCTPARAQKHELDISLGSLHPEGVAQRVDGRTYTLISFQAMTAQSRTASVGFFFDIGNNNTFTSDRYYRDPYGQTYSRPYQVIYGGGLQARVTSLPSTNGNRLYASAGLGHYNLAEYERVASNYYYDPENPFYDIPTGSLYLGMTAKMSVGVEFKRNLFLEATYYRPVKSISDQRGLTGFAISLGVIAGLLWIGISSFRRIERGFADLI